MFGNNNQDNSNDQNTQDNTNDFGGLGQDNGVPTVPAMPAAAAQASPFGSTPTGNDQPQADDPASTAPATAPLQPEEQAAPQEEAPAAHHDAVGHGDGGTHGASSELVDIKQQALQHLSPLVSHLDQTPEEKFRTTMMMIQATDDQSLLKTAYEAAQKIEDDKARAQALLDVINEINYFTQQHNS